MARPLRLTPGRKETPISREITPIIGVFCKLLPGNDLRAGVDKPNVYD